MLLKVCFSIHNSTYLEHKLVFIPSVTRVQQRQLYIEFTVDADTHFDEFSIINFNI